MNWLTWFLGALSAAAITAAHQLIVDRRRYGRWLWQRGRRP